MKHKRTTDIRMQNDKKKNFATNLNKNQKRFKKTA